MQKNEEKVKTLKERNKTDEKQERNKETHEIKKTIRKKIKNH